MSFLVWFSLYLEKVFFLSNSKKIPADFPFSINFPIIATSLELI